VQDDMVNLIDNLVKLGLAPPAEWMAGFVAAASQAAAEMRSKDYLRLLLALASCGWRPDDAEAFKRLVERSFPMMQVGSGLEGWQVEFGSKGTEGM